MFCSSECHLHKFRLGGTYCLIAELIFNLPLKNINASFSILLKSNILTKCLKEKRNGNAYLWKQHLTIVYWNCKTFPKGSYFFLWLLYWCWHHSAFIGRLIFQHSVATWTFWTWCYTMIFFALLNMNHSLSRSWKYLSIYLRIKGKQFFQK